MWGIFGAGFGALIKTAAMIVMIMLGFVAAYEERQLQMWLYFGGAAVVIGMGLVSLSPWTDYGRRCRKWGCD